MDEFLVAIMTGIAFLLYTSFTYFIFRSKWKITIRWALLLLLVVVVILHLMKKRLIRRRLRKMEIDEESYLFYNKYTSLRNKISFIVTYLIQDYVYEVKRNNKSYNFSKGLFRYEEGLGEYYIDYRLTWYDYIRLNLMKNRLSLHKLRIFSLNKCNKMILERFPEQQETYKAVRENWTEIVNGLTKKQKPKKGALKKIEGAKSLDKLLIKNLYQMEVSRSFLMKHKKDYEIMMKKMDKRKEDVREVKNFYVDLNEPERPR